MLRNKRDDRNRAPANMRASARSPDVGSVRASGATTSHGTVSIYPEREDTLLLAPFARAGATATVLDLGTGNGRLALEAARSGSRVVATDLNRAALHALADRVRREELPVAVVRTDLARGLGRFDRVVANPPYLPTRARERDPDRWANLALDGGPDGCRVLRRLVAALPEHLAPGGVAYVLVSSLQAPAGRDRVRARWRASGRTVRTVASRFWPGERLEVWELKGPAARRRAAPRSVRPRRGTDGRRRPRGRNPSGSNPALGRGRTSARGAASARRRSRPGS